jgi:protein-tyrosine phosphatase
MMYCAHPVSCFHSIIRRALRKSSMELDSAASGYSRRLLRACLPVEIVPRKVYLGTAASVTTSILRLVGITAVCACAQEEANTVVQEAAAAGAEVHVLPLFDTMQQDLLPLLPQAIEFIEHHTSSSSPTPASSEAVAAEASESPSPSGRVLIVCSDGNSRAAAVAVAFVSKTMLLPFDEALQVVIQAKGDACPNPHFQSQLKEYAETLSLPAASAAVVSGGGRGGFFSDLKRLSKEAIIARVMFYPSLFGNIVMCNQHLGKWRCSSCFFLA